MTKNIRILLIEDASPTMKILNNCFSTTEEKKYICPNYDAATETITKISQNFNEHEDFLFVILDRSLGHASKDGVDLFFQLHNTFPSQNLYIVNFSSNPKEFAEAIAQIDQTIKFDAQTAPEKTPLSCRKLFDAYQKNINHQAIVEETKEATINSINTDKKSSTWPSRFFCPIKIKGLQYTPSRQVHPENGGG